MQGKLFFALIASLLLAGGAAHLVYWRYRRRVVALMSRGKPPREDASASPTLPETIEPSVEPKAAPKISTSANRKTRRRLPAVLILLSLSIGVSVAAFQLTFVYTEGGFGPIKLMIMGMIYASPIIPALGTLWRWSWGRVLGAAVLYLLFCAAIVQMRSTDEQSIVDVLMWLAGQIGLPLAAVLILTGSGKARAAAPYLFPPFVILTVSSIIGLDVLAGALDSEVSPVIAGLASVLGAELTFFLFVVLPWIIAFWPIRLLVRWLARCYRDKRFSEVMYLFGGYWLIALIFYALPPFSELGGAAFAILAAWLWIPVGFRLARPLLQPKHAGPVLLVLRVFRRDAEVENLFDRVIERWRSTGSVTLIAGSDLVSRTMDPDDLFAYVQGSLGDRFIGEDYALQREVSHLDIIADPDGRFRINDFYCFDTTWQSVLLALVVRADRVLMDLRGFTKKNRGCLFELEALGKATHVRRIVLLTDGETDRDAARSALGLANAAADRIVWEDLGVMNRRKAELVLGRLRD